MTMFDFHTHVFNEDTSLSRLLSIDVQDADSCSLPSCAILSVGLHPWRTDAYWQRWMPHLTELAMMNNVFALGECGLDKMRGADMDVQMAAMRAQMEIAEEADKPIVVHCVKAFGQLLTLRKEAEQRHSKRGKLQPWVIHGFRGKPELAKQLMAKGIRISLGHQYNIETLHYLFSCNSPFYLETDDCPISIEDVYLQASHHLGVDVCHLVNRCNPFVDLFHPATL